MRKKYYVYAKRVDVPNVKHTITYQTLADKYLTYIFDICEDEYFVVCYYDEIQRAINNHAGDIRQICQQMHAWYGNRGRLRLYYTKSAIIAINTELIRLTNIDGTPVP